MSHSASSFEEKKNKKNALMMMMKFHDAGRIVFFKSRGFFKGSFTPVLKQHSEERVVPFSSDLMYHVVASVEQYKDFVPYTLESNVLRRVSKDESVCQLKVGFGMLSESYNSRVRCFPKEKRVTAIAEDSSLFKTLSTEWILQDRPLDPQSCLLQYKVEFQFHSMIHNNMADMFFDKITKTMVDAFLAQCSVVREHRKSMPKKPSLSLYKLYGCKDSTPASVLGELESLSHFSLVELERIQKRFDNAAHGDKAMDLKMFTDLFSTLFSNTGHSITDLESCAMNIFQALDSNRDEKISLREFTAGLSTVLKGTKEERCRFWFRCYDKDSDGKLSKEELHDMILTSMSVRNALIKTGAVSKMTDLHHSLVIHSDVEKVAKSVVEKCFDDSEHSKSLSITDILPFF